MDDSFFNKVVVRDEINKLRALLRAIPKWEEVAVAEVDVQRLEMSSIATRLKLDERLKSLQRLQGAFETWFIRVSSG